MLVLIELEGRRGGGYPRRKRGGRGTGAGGIYVVRG